MATRVIYVFFDPQCPHCAALWENIKPLKSQVRLVWIPVGLIGEKSVAQGAAILADGLAGGSAADVVQTLGIREATGTVLDHLYVITPEAARQRLGI